MYFYVPDEVPLDLKQAQLAQLDAELQAVAPGLPSYQDVPELLHELNAIQAYFGLNKAQLFAGLARISQAIRELGEQSRQKLLGKSFLFTFMLNYLCEPAVSSDFDLAIGQLSHLITSGCGLAIGVLGEFARQFDAPEYITIKGLVAVLNNLYISDIICAYDQIC